MRTLYTAYMTLSTRIATEILVSTLSTRIATETCYRHKKWAPNLHGRAAPPKSKFDPPRQCGRKLGLLYATSRQRGGAVFGFLC